MTLQHQVMRVAALSWYIFINFSSRKQVFAASVIMATRLGWQRAHSLVSLVVQSKALIKTKVFERVSKLSAGTEKKDAA